MTLNTTISKASGCNSSTYGYNVGGRTGTDTSTVSTVSYFAFPFDSGTSIAGGSLASTRHLHASCNSTSYGYVMGGLSSGSSISTAILKIERFAFPFLAGSASEVGEIGAKRFLTAATDNVDFKTMFV